MRTVRQFFLGMIFIIVILGLIQLGQADHQVRAEPNVQSSATVISDGTFNPVDWVVSVEATNGASHTVEILKVLLVDSPTLRDQAVTTVELWQDNLRSLIDGDGSAVITQAQVDAIKGFLTNLSAAGSAELQQLIAAELNRLGPLDDYVGMTVQEAKSKAIGDPVVYLPIVFK